MKTFLTVFVSVFLAEIGDKTQLATFLFASEAGKNRLTVFLGAASALVAASAIAVVAGDTLSRYVNPKYLHTIAGIGFIVIGIVMLIHK